VTATLTPPASAKTPSALDDFFFDLNGYLVLRNAVGPDLLERLEAAFDSFPDIGFEQWWGNAQRRDYNPHVGYELHNVVECGEPFEELIDNPGWINYVRRYCGEVDSFMEGLFIDEAIASRRNAGGHHPVHSGGYRAACRTRYEYQHGVFRCGQCNVILTLRDIGPGDGATMVIPGSHKSNFPHPEEGDYQRGDRMDALPGAIPLYMNAGDALLFVDGLMHGGSSRTNDGERRVTIYRYGRSWGRTRFNYEYSQQLLDRLTPERRKILQPVAPLRPPTV